MAVKSQKGIPHQITPWEGTPVLMYCTGKRFFAKLPATKELASSKMTQAGC
jgi:hypothetical protein